MPGLCVQWSHKLMDMFENPVMIQHPRGHVVPSLEGEKLEVVRAFLTAWLQDSAM